MNTSLFNKIYILLFLGTSCAEVSLAGQRRHAKSVNISNCTLLYASEKSAHKKIRKNASLGHWMCKTLVFLCFNQWMLSQYISDSNFFSSCLGPARSCSQRYESSRKMLRCKLIQIVRKKIYFRDELTQENHCSFMTQEYQIKC